MKSAAVLLRVLFWLGICGAFAVAIWWKIGQFELSKQENIVSLYAEWEQHGLPVSVKQVSTGEFAIFTKASARPVSTRSLEIYVTPKDHSLMRPGLPFQSDGGQPEIRGRVESISEKVDLNSGLFVARLQSGTAIDTSKISMIPVQIRTSRLLGVITVPISSVVRDSDRPYVWKINNAVAEKTEVKLGTSDAETVVVQKGLRDGDLIVTEGVKPLTAGSKIRIFKCVGCEKSRLAEKPKG